MTKSRLEGLPICRALTPEASTFEIDRENHVGPASYILRPTALTDSEAILTPDIWHPQGPQFRPAINSGESGVYEYRFPVEKQPRDSGRISPRQRGAPEKHQDSRNKARML